MSQITLLCERDTEDFYGVFEPLNNPVRHKFAMTSPYKPLLFAILCAIGVTDHFLCNHSFVLDKTSRSEHLSHCKYRGNLILFLYDSPYI